MDLGISGEPPKLSTGVNAVGATDDSKHHSISPLQEDGGGKRDAYHQPLKLMERTCCFSALTPLLLDLVWRGLHEANKDVSAPVRARLWVLAPGMLMTVLSVRLSVRTR